jgi:cyclohexa-1,5-dienecarbonyl-CoA hydratase
MKYENIIFEEKDRLAKIIFNKPPLNIIDINTINEMIDAMESVRKSNNKALIITGTGEKAFSAGVSVQDHLPDKVETMIPLFGKIFRTMLSLDQPIIAVVRGYVLGGGCEVAAFCDIVIASENAKFGQPDITLGNYPPLAVATYPRILGMKRAFEFLITGETIDATKAKEIGLVNIVAKDEELEKEVDKFIKKILNKSLVAIKATKRAIYSGYDLGFEEALTVAEYIYLNILAKSKDGVEGLKAFLEKREPVWSDE